MKSGGADDIRRHVEGPRHVQNSERSEKEKKTVKSNSLITGFFQKGPSETVTNFEMDVISAEVKMVDLVIDTA